MQSTAAIPARPVGLPESRARLQASLWALLCAALVLTWQAATVHYSYGGNWTALFCTGALFPTPPDILNERVYRFPGSFGWDGQQYHDIAHDPFFSRGYAKYIDAPRFRYRRILVPAAAWLLALSGFDRVDVSYRIVILACVWFGAFLLARLAQSAGRRPAWGLTFLFVPATLVSIDRMAVDIALVTLCAGFIYCAHREAAGWRIYLILVLAPLARETGFILIAAYCGWLAARRDFKRTALYATAILPALSWYAFVQARTTSFTVPRKGWIPLSGNLDLFFHPFQYPTSIRPVAALLSGLDILAGAGVLLATILTFLMFVKFRRDAIAWMALGFAALAIFAWTPGLFPEAWDYTRIFSPLLMAVAVPFVDSRRWIWLAPWAMTVPRVCAQFGPQVVHVVRGITGGIL